MRNRNFKRGFTLIELLVVVAIIGILASVVLASLNSARAKGADAATEANLSNARAQAELFYDSASPNSYTNVCTTGTNNISASIAAATKSSGGTASCYNSPSGDAWAAWAPLKVTTGHYWCVDSTGASKEETAAPAAGASVCP